MQISPSVQERASGTEAGAEQAGHCVFTSGMNHRHVIESTHVRALQCKPAYQLVNGAFNLITLGIRRNHISGARRRWSGRDSNGLSTSSPN